MYRPNIFLGPGLKAKLTTPTVWSTTEHGSELYSAPGTLAVKVILEIEMVTEFIVFHRPGAAFTEVRGGVLWEQPLNSCLARSYKAAWPHLA